MKNLRIVKIHSIFVVLKKAKDMKLTEKEKELIEAIRNFLKSKHNSSIELEFYARELFEKMMDGEEEEEEKEK